MYLGYMAEQIPAAEGPGPMALNTVIKLVDSALNPMLQLIEHLRDKSAFVKAVKQLGVDKEKEIGFDAEIEQFFEAMQKFQTRIRLYANLEAEEGKVTMKALTGGTRKHQAKRRASTRGSYRRQRY